MTDVHPLRRGGVIEDSRDEQARRAVKAFRDFQPTLSSYARALTGRPDVRVELHSSSNGMTDGKIIYYRPPIELGDNTPHVRRLCNKRGDMLQLMCKACRMREKVLVTIYHEINHIAEGTFAPTTEADKAEAIRRAIEEVGTKYARQIENAVKNAPSHVKDSYLGLAGIISPFLPVIVNALEDARVNTRGFHKRKGTRVMFNADTQNIFAEGVEQKDPATGEITKVMWKDYPLNMQVSVGVFCKASGYDYENWFAPVVKQALDDPALTDLISQIDGADGPQDSFELSFKILARLRELGFCKSDKDPEDEDESATGDPSLPSAGEDQPDSESGPSGPSGDSDEDDAAGSDDEAPRDGSESGHGDSESDGQVAGSEAEAEEDDSDGGDDSASAGSEDDADEDTGGEPASDSGSEESDGGDGGDSQGEAQRDDSTGGESEHGDSSAGSTESGSAQEQELGGSSTGEGSEAVDEDSGPEEDSEGHSTDQSGASGTSRQGSGEVSDRDEDSGEDSDSTSNGEQVDEAGDREESGRPERDAGVEHSEGSGNVDSVDADAEPDEQEDSSPHGTPDEEHQEGGEPAPIDTGADEGLGGVQLIIPDDAVMGDADDAMEALKKVEQHEDRPTTAEMRKNDEAMEVAVIQGLYFETPSSNIKGVRENRYGVASGTRNSWENAERFSKNDRIIRGIDGDFDPSEEMLGPALLHMRVVFADNKRGHDSIHLKSGRVNARVLGKRAPVHDPRLFKKRTQPGKKDYFVVIGVDISGSTVGENLVLTKRAVMAQATLLSRMGIKFAIYAHSGDYDRRTGDRDLDLDIYLVKEPDEPWSEPVKDRLRKLSSYVVNLDGHALEYLRKVADRSNATDKIILYYSDGKMPAENHDEELEILQREIQLCARKGYTLLGVGIRTDSPARHGLDTVQVDDNSDLVKVVRHIEKRLLAQ